MIDPVSGRASVRRLIPDSLTFVRVPIGLAGAWTLIADRGAVAACLYLIGYVTDVADGWTARALRVSSSLGRRLDGIADVTFHALFGVALAIAATDDGMWWVIGVLVTLVVGGRILRRWIRSYTVIGKAIAGVYRIVMFTLLLMFTPPDPGPTLIVVGLLVMIVTYVYEGRNTFLELRSGEREVR
jgi:phosphatidylglycerophosphate synthase